MNYTAASFNPATETVSLINKAATKLVPEDGTLAAWHTDYIKNHRSRIAIDVEIIKKYVNQDQSILEFGSVPLLLTTAMALNSYNITGIDIHPERYKDTIEKVGIQVLKCDIEHEKLPIEGNSYDAIIFNELFEHLRINPIFTLSEALRVLKPGGVMLMSTPNLRSMMGIYNFLFKKRAYSACPNIYVEYQKLEKLGHMGHVREYTPVEVIEFLSNVGFTVTELVYRGRYGTNLTQLIARIFPKSRPFVTYVAKK